MTARSPVPIRRRPCCSIRVIVAANIPIDQHLAGYAGLTQADAYAGFAKLLRGQPQKRSDHRSAAVRWAHARRKFFDLGG